MIIIPYVYNDSQQRLAEKHTDKNKDGLSWGKQIKKPLWRFFSLQRNGRDDGWRVERVKWEGFKWDREKDCERKIEGNYSSVWQEKSYSLSFNVKLFPGWLLKASIINIRLNQRFCRCCRSSQNVTYRNLTQLAVRLSMQT